MSERELMASWIEWLSHKAILAVVVLVPLVFVPILGEAYVLPKVLLIVGGVVMGAVAWLASQVLRNEIRWWNTSLTIPLVLLGIGVIISTVVQSPNVTEALGGKVSVILAGTVLTFLLTGQSRNWRKQLLWGLVLGSTLVAIEGILGFGGVMQKFGFLPAFMKSKGWNSLGSPFNLAVWLVPVIALIASWDEGEKREWVWVRYGLAALMGVAVILSVWLMMPGREFAPRLLPYQSAYAIVVDNLKEARTAVLGVGPENFISAFTRLKPVGINQTSVWNVRLANSSSEFLHMLTTMGFLGVVSLGFLIWKVVGLASLSSASKLQKQMLVPLGVLGGLGMFLPWGVEMWFMLFLLLGIFGGETREMRRWEYKEPLLGMFLMILPLGLAVTVVYLGGRLVKGEMALAKSLQAFAANDGLAVYNLQRTAIAANPYKTSYRIVYSRTNLALADSISKRENASEQDKQNVNVLVQQAIREAKTAVSLNPQNVATWENLAFIYRQLINFAQGADQFAVQSYQQALVLDPRNPILWLDYGGLLYGLKQYDEAEQAFRQAVALKGDFANARYNLAKAYEVQGKYAKAAGEMALVVSLVPPGSADAKKAQEELTAINEKLPKTQQPVSREEQIRRQLTEPQPLPSKAPGTEPIELPREAAPEVSVAPWPSVTPSLVPEVSPTP